MLRRSGRKAAVALPAALLAELGMPTLGAVVFLAVMALAVACWVIASGDRTNRVSQMMLALRGEASRLAPGTAPPAVPAAGLATASDAEARYSDRSV